MTHLPDLTDRLAECAGLNSRAPPSPYPSACREKAAASGCRRSTKGPWRFPGEAWPAGRGGQHLAGAPAGPSACVSEHFSPAALSPPAGSAAPAPRLRHALRDSSDGLDSARAPGR